MYTQTIAEIEKAMQNSLSSVQMERLHNVLTTFLKSDLDDNAADPNTLLRPLETYIAAKRVEGCSEKTLRYYESTITQA